MHSSQLRGLAVACLFAAATCAVSSRAATPLKAMLLDGESGGPYHAWQTTTPVLKKELEETGMFRVDVVTAPKSNEDFSRFHPDFAAYKVVVSNLDSEEWPAPLRTAFEQYVKAGGGVVIVHAADNAFPKWAAYNEMIGIGGWRKRDAEAGPRWFFENGKLTSDPSPGPAGSHGKRLPILVTIQDSNHPITKGLPKEWLHVADELYAGLRGPGKNMKVLATAHSDPANHGTGHDEPMLMVLNYGKGRIFHTTLGHDVTALSCVGFITTLQRGAQWAATGKVTQKLPASFPTADRVSSRPDILQMQPPPSEKKQ